MARRPAASRIEPTAGPTCEQRPRTATPRNAPARGAIVTYAALLLMLAIVLLVPEQARAGAFLSRAEALELAFPGCAVTRQARYLTPEQQSRAQRTARTAIDSRLVIQYVATCSGEPAGAAYFDVHRVRTLAETLMVAVGADGRVNRVEVVSFLEPAEYIPRRNWYDLFLRRRLDSELRLKRSIHAVTGATLTARATTDAVRRVLALHEVLGMQPQEEDRPTP